MHGVHISHSKLTQVHPTYKKLQTAEPHAHAHVHVTIATPANLSNGSEEVWNESRGEKLSHNLIAVVALWCLALWDLCHILPALSLLSRCAKEVLDEDRADQIETGVKVTRLERNCRG